MAHWKTTVGGLVSALCVAWTPFAAALDGGPIDWPRFGLATVIAVGGWWARDRV